MEDNLTEVLAALALRVKEQELSTQYLLQLIAGLVNPDNPEHAYNYFRTRQQAYVAQAPELSNIRAILETIERAKGSES